MKKKLLLLLFTTVSLVITSCAVKNGCPGSGRNIGAEKLLSDDNKVKKDLRKAGKFRGGKF